MTYLGLDLGTGFAKLARAAGEPGQAGVAPAVTRLPAAVLYGDQGAEIPLDFPDEPRRRAVRCDGFPPLLGTPLSASPVPGWRDRTPAEVASRFLDRLPGLQPSELVATVAPVADPGPRAELTELLTAAGRAPLRVIATPVAALLWLRERDHELAKASRVVVVDAGAGSLDLTLCTVTDRAVRVADSMRVTGRSAWEGGNPVDTVVGDRPATLAECLAAAMVAAAGGRLGRDGRTPAYWWRALERALADQNARDRLDAVLQLASEAMGRHGSAIALRFGGLEVTAGRFMEACAPLADQSVTVLSQLLSRQRDPGWLRFGSGDATRLLLFGGLQVLSPLRLAILTTAGLDPDRPDGVVLPGNDDLLGAAARGAALLAAGQADVGDRYPHGLRLRVKRIVRDEVVTEDLPLAAPGTVSLEAAETTYLTAAAVRRDQGEDTAASHRADSSNRAGEYVLVTVEQAPPGEQASVPVPVQLVPRGAAPVPAAFKSASPPPPGVYRIGVRGGTSGPAVVLQPAAGGEPLVYPLADRQGAVGSWPSGQAVQ